MLVSLRSILEGSLLIASLWRTVTADAEEYIILKKSGGFAVGGTVIANSTSGESLSCDHGYMEYFIPARPRKSSLVMWHSSSTQVFQNRWDGGEGFKDKFLRRNYPVYLWDGPRTGRADWGCKSYTYVPEYYSHWNFEAGNFGPKYGEWWNDTQFPRNESYAWDQAMRARYNKFNTVDNVHVQSDAAAVAADSGRLGDSIVYLTDSAAGMRALLTAVKSMSSNIKAIVAYDCSGFVYPDNIDISNITSQANVTNEFNITHPSGIPVGFVEPGSFGPFLVPVEAFKRLANLSIQFVWGDHRSESYAAIKSSRQVAQLINSYGGNAEVIKLGEVGLKGSSHIPMADMDNDKVAGILDQFLQKNHLDEYE